MKRCRNIPGTPVQILMSFAGTVLLLLVCSQLAIADEPAEEFLQALRERGYYDVALHYLDGVAESDSVPDSFKQKVAFQKAGILLDSVNKIRNPEEMGKRLDEADRLLAEHASSVSDPIEATEVLKIQSNVKYFRGRNNLKQAALDRTPDSRKKELFLQAQKFLGDALPKFRQVQQAQREQIENFQIDPEDPKSDEKLRALQASYVDTRLKIPVAMEKLALAFNDDKSSRNAKLIEAGAEFESVARLYDQRFVQGQMAKAFAARCFQQAGDYGKASELLKDVFNYPNPSSVLVQQGLSVGVETWPNVEPYPTRQVIAAAEGPVAMLTRRDKANPMWLRVELELARAKYERSVAIKDEDSSAASRLKKEASRLAREVARRRNPHSKLAAELLGDWGVSIEAASEEPATMVANATASSFDDAIQKSKDLIGPLSDQLSELAVARRQLATARDASAKSNQQMEVDKLQTSVDQRADQTLGMLAQAVRLADEETPRAQLNNVRYLQAYCHFAKRRFSNSAVMGRFLLEKFPTIEWSQQAAGLMVRSYEKMFDSSTGQDRVAARDKVIDAASAMMEMWPDASESSAAAVSATRVAVIDDDFDSANRFFERIPANSPTRGPLASRIGQQIWGERKSATTDDAKQKITDNARKYLTIAVESADPAAMDFSTAVAALYLVDACRESGELDEAISRVDAILQNLDTNPAISKSAKYRQSAYNASLNTWLDALGSKPDAQTWIDKSKNVIEKMSAEAAGDPAAIQNVSRVYRKVARDLTDRFESLPSLQEKETFATSLQSFFAGIGSVAKDGKTRLWAGSTLLGIAESLKLEGGDANSKQLAGDAIALLEAAKKAGFGKDKSLELNYQHQLALAQRCSGDFEAAVSSFEKILETANGLNLQIDAAKTLLMWGIEKKDTKALTSSMNGRGQYRDPKTNKLRKRIWGWKLLVSLTRSKENLREQFRECEYYSVLCRFRYGQIANNPKAIDSAYGELQKALKRFDDLAVGAWKKKYDQLLKELESAK
ncbi:hypothetical protein [Mariniblastus fucicola]|nr:hypothetical protein [Mariniblastus fucicola]